MKKIISYCCGLLFLSSVVFADAWVKKQHSHSLKRVFSQIADPDQYNAGFVVAAPSAKPNYFYHWVRDAALVMKSLDEVLPWSKKKRSLFEAYLNRVLMHQATWSLTNLGEPKFYEDGSSFQGPWGRPQNDGPALRALALMSYANYLLSMNEDSAVKEKLYASELPANTAIKRDLEYVAHHWRDLDFDLWEEVKGHHFYTRMVQQSALSKGALFAEKLGDFGAAVFYRQQAQFIQKELSRHWNSAKQQIDTTLDRATNEGLDYKYSNLDSSVLLAAIHVDEPSQPFGVTDPRVQATFVGLVQGFQKIYPLNHHADSQGEIAVGRYPEDRYFGGQPWFLINHGFAESLLEMTKQYARLGKIDVTPVNQKFFSLVCGGPIQVKMFDQNDPQFAKLQTGLKRFAQRFILSSELHSDPSGQMDEQFSRDNGFMLSATNLTWSYASFLTMSEHL